MKIKMCALCPNNKIESGRDSEAVGKTNWKQKCSLLKLKRQHKTYNRTENGNREYTYKTQNPKVYRPTKYVKQYK